MLNAKILTLLGTIAALTVLPTGLAYQQASAHSAQENQPEQTGIVGTWRILVTPSTAGAPPFFVYITFNRGGTLIQSTEASLEGSRPGHGVWKKTGKNEFKMTFEKFIDFNPLTQTPGIVVFKAEATIQQTGQNNYHSSAQASICDNANLVQTCQPLFRSTTEAIRLTVD